MSGEHMALRTLCRTIDWPLKRASAGAFWETTATRSCDDLVGDRARAPAPAGCRPCRLREIVGTSSPVSSLRSSDGDPVDAHDLERRVHDGAEQPVEIQLGRELLRDLEQHLQLERLAGLAGGGADAELARAGGTSRLVMPGGTPAAHHELSHDLAAGRRRASRGDGGALDRRAMAAWPAQAERAPCRR